MTSAYFLTKLVATGGKPSVTQKPIVKFMKFKEKSNLCDIEILRKLLKKSFTRKYHFSDITNRRLDCIFLSDRLQEFSQKSEIIPTFNKR